MFDYLYELWSEEFEWKVTGLALLRVTTSSEFHSPCHSPELGRIITQYKDKCGTAHAAELREWGESVRILMQLDNVVVQAIGSVS